MLKLNLWRMNKSQTIENGGRDIVGRDREKSWAKKFDRRPLGQNLPLVFCPRYVYQRIVHQRIWSQGEDTFSMQDFPSSFFRYFILKCIFLHPTVSQIYIPPISFIFSLYHCLGPMSLSSRWKAKYKMIKAKFTWPWRSYLTYLSVSSSFSWALDHNTKVLNYVKLHAVFGILVNVTYMVPTGIIGSL